MQKLDAWKKRGVKQDHIRERTGLTFNLYAKYTGKGKGKRKQTYPEQHSGNRAKNKHFSADG